jgi:thioredoxin 2
MDAIEIACPHCATVNRVPAERLGEAPTCGRCKAKLFEGKPVELDEQNFEQVIGRTDLPVVVDFWAPWCGPCRNFAPTYAEAAKRLEPHVRLAKLDTEAHPGPASRFGIRSIPTLIVFRGGRELNRISGALPLPQFMQWVAQTVANSP